ncbi:MAG: helix-turn-helix transcriptional regulator [Robiginitomaculum sp.]|nr:helix-turn-helix transcriptional regulator [Robiginitomaculum sp.]
MNTELIDRIYEASFVPELWPNLLDDIAALTEGKGGLLLTVRDKMLNWTSSDNLEEVFGAYLKEGWFQRCDRRVCMFKKAHSEFLIENDYWTQEEFASNKVYEDFFRPRGLGFSAGTGVQVPTGDGIVFFVERTYERGPMEKNYVQQLNDLRPHLARSAFVASRLGLQSATSASEALSKLGLATILLDAAGGAVQSHNLSDDISEHIIWGAHNRVILKDKNADVLFKNTMDALHQHPASPVKSFPIRGKDGQAALVGHIVPLSRSVLDIFAGSYAILILTPVTAKNVPTVDLVRSLFDFTASEARVARGLASGHSVEDIANEGGVALSTVRTQLRRIMEKTGCSRQAEVVALMANIALNR